MERGRRRKGEVKGVLVSEYTSVLLQLDERWQVMIYTLI